jgi:K+-sensing histidine kinase KdpD
VRELMHARRERRLAPPFARVVLGVRARERDLRLIERMSQLAMRLSIELLVVHVKPPGAPVVPAFLAKLEGAVRSAHAHLQIVEDRDAAAALLAVAKELDVIAIESPRGRRRLFSPPSFANRLLQAGCREMLVLTPRD